MHHSSRSLNDVLVRVVNHLFHILSFFWPTVGSSNSEWCGIGFLGHGSNFFHSRGCGFSLEVGGLSGLVAEGYGRCICPRRPWVVSIFFQVAPSWCPTSLLLTFPFPSLVWVSCLPFSVLPSPAFPLGRWKPPSFGLFPSWSSRCAFSGRRCSGSC